MSEEEALAKRFHELYESLAHKHDYETREETNVPWDDLPGNNKNLMIQVCKIISTERTLPASIETVLEAARRYERSEARHHVMDLDKKSAHENLIETIRKHDKGRK